MKSLGLALALTLALVAGSARAALADGWGADGCRDESSDNYVGCTSDGNTSSCQCDSSESTGSSRRAASIGTSLGLLSFVTYRLRRRRTRRTR